jgi:hypothetical protein
MEVSGKLCTGQIQVPLKQKRQLVSRWEKKGPSQHLHEQDLAPGNTCFQMLELLWKKEIWITKT